MKTHMHANIRLHIKQAYNEDPKHKQAKPHYMVTFVVLLVF